MKNNILIVDDEAVIRDILFEAFSNEPYGVFSASSAVKAFDILENQPIDVVISDELMPGMHGSEFLAVVRKKYPETIRMILTGHASLESAIRAINEGEIYRFFTKPCNIVDLLVTVRQALEHRDLMKGSQRLVKIVKGQNQYIETLEREYPGITDVKRNEKGAIVLDDIGNPGDKNPVDDIDALLKEYSDKFPQRT
ncbi:MAG: response regulator [Pseudomonadota bacterium]